MGSVLMKNLFEIRTKKKMSQVNLSVKIGVAQETISAYESGRSFPSVDTLLKLCEIFNVSADYLLDKTNISTSVNNLLVDNLNSKELEIIALYREIPADKKERAIGLMIGLKD
jgi:transcriptional regulator with XRE-family HTH domain